MRGGSFEFSDEKEPLGITKCEKDNLPWKMQKRPRHELSRSEMVIFKKHIKKLPVGRHQLSDLLLHDIRKVGNRIHVNDVW